MINKNIEEIIIKFLNRSLNSKELNYLNEWILKSKNEALFENFIRSHFEITMGMNEPDVEDIKEKLFNEIRNDKSLIYKIKSNPLYRLGAAAIIVLLFSLPFIIKTLNSDIDNNTIINPNIVKENIEPGTDKATLTLEDGSQVVLEKGESLQTQNASSNGEKIVYKAGKRKSKEIAYHFLTVPRGGEFFIKLSDGTRVWLNSESQLKFPVSFLEGETRVVELVYGEAYFDVSSSANHSGAEFKVLNNAQEIQVLGTQFNVKAYKDESNIYTTLVEGKVAVTIEDKKQKLIPNQQLNLDLVTNTSSLKTVDVYNEVSWKEGVFSFDGKSIYEVMKVLSRWYNINVIFQNNLSKDNDFVGVLRKNKSIDEILSNIKNSGIITDYEIKGNKVILK